MAEAAGSSRRERVERNIYRRGTGVFEVGFRDATGKQRWRTVTGGITAARALRDEPVARRNRGERVVHSASLRFADVAEKWLEGPVSDLRPRTGECYRNSPNGISSRAWDLGDWIESLPMISRIWFVTFASTGYRNRQLPSRSA